MLTELGFQRRVPRSRKSGETNGGNSALVAERVRTAEVSIDSVSFTLCKTISREHLSDSKRLVCVHWFIGFTGDANLLEGMRRFRNRDKAKKDKICTW